MHNVFQQRLFDSERCQSVSRARNERIHQQKTALLREEMRETAAVRMMEWTKTNLDSEMARTLLTGAVPLLPPSQHQYREDDKSRANIYVRRYLPAATRAADAQKDYEDSHLPYFRSAKRTQTERNPAAPRFHYKSQEARQRVKNAVKDSRIVHAGAESRTEVLFPEYRNWKGRAKTTKREFNRFSKQFGGDSVWPVTGRCVCDDYIDGLAAIGQFTRKRDFGKEAAGDFHSVSPRDIWPISPVRSNRCSKASALLLKLTPRSDASKTTKFSATNSFKSMKIYKKSVESLLTTKATRPEIRSDLPE